MINKCAIIETTNIAHHWLLHYQVSRKGVALHYSLYSELRPRSKFWPKFLLCNSYTPERVWYPCYYTRPQLRGRVLITGIPYKWMGYNLFISHTNKSKLCIRQLHYWCRTSNKVINKCYSYHTVITKISPWQLLWSAHALGDNLTDLSRRFQVDCWLYRIFRVDCWLIFWPWSQLGVQNTSRQNVSECHPLVKGVALQ